MKSFKNFVGVESEEKTFTEEVDEACTLSRTQRMYGFIGCFIVGWVITLLSVLALPQIVSEPARFAILYTVGNIVALCSTFFFYSVLWLS